MYKPFRPCINSFCGFYGRLLIFLVIPIVGCSGTSQPEISNTLERIKASGVLRWGADSSGGAPFCFNNPYNANEIVGFEVELIGLIARRMGVRPKLVSTDWNTLPSTLDSKRIDLILNGLEVTEFRRQKVAFTQPYFRFIQQVAVRSEDTETYPKLASLKGQLIGVLNGTASIEALAKLGWMATQLIQFDDSLKPFEALKSRRVQAVVCESIIAAYYADADPDFTLLPDVFSPGNYAAAVRLNPEDQSLLQEIEGHLQELKTNGQLGELYQRWGIWEDRLQEIGVVKGSAQNQIELARPGFRLTWYAIYQLLRLLLQGAGVTFLLTVFSMPLALSFGLFLALLARSDRCLLSIPANLYVQVIRGTPLLVQIWVIFFSLPLLGKLLDDTIGVALFSTHVAQSHLFARLLTWPAFAVGVLCLAANYAAYEAEVHRAGLDAIPRGQHEAAMALGMTEIRAFFHVILPQSFRIILPPVFNDLNSMLKDTCLVSVIGVAELLFVANSAGKATFLYAQTLLIAAAMYLIMSLLGDWIGNLVEKRIRLQGHQQTESAKSKDP